MLSLWQIIGLAFVMDLILGDPRTRFHPVCLMGNLIQRLESPFRKLPVPTTLSGGMFALFLVGVIYGGTWLMLAVAGMSHPWLKSVVEVIICYFCLAGRSLYAATGEVTRPLQRGNVETARSAVSMVVGRDTTNLNSTQICQATIETLAENLVDGVLSPLFWMALGGAPTAAAFKMTNTLDSMVGYRNERYHAFGKASARLDDVANFIPARLSVPIIALAAAALNLSARQALKTAVLEGRRHKSPNAGYSEAAFAGALQVRLNGPAVYGGKWVDKPFLGIRFGNPGRVDVTRAGCLMLVSFLVGTVLTIFILFAISMI